MKKLISMLLCISLMVSLFLPVSVTASEYTSQFDYEAQMLYNLGLFKGTENGFDLAKPCDRLQGSALFIRLLGEEKEAMNNPKSHSFTDVKDNWASPYVGQMYEKGYTKGISDTEYGISNMTANQFATFCLRALNYNDSAGDFHYDSALSKMRELYLINQETYDLISSQDFCRDFAVKLAYSTLFGDIKGTEKEYKHSEDIITYPLGSRDILVMNLIRAGVVDKNIFENSILKIYDDLYFYTSYETASQIALACEEKAKYVFFLKYDNTTFDSIPDICGILPRYDNTISRDELVNNDLVTCARYMGDGNIYRIKINYSDIYRCSMYIKNPGSIELTEPEKEIVEYTQKNFLNVYIKEGMSDYDKLLAAYKFTGDHIAYGYIERHNSVIYTSLFENQGKCYSYALLFLYLANVLDFEVYYIEGMAGTIGNDDQNGPHAWNKIKLGDDYYNLDPTWDDNNLNNTYFLVSDEFISSSHWDYGTDIDSINKKIKATNTQYERKLD